MIDLECILNTGEQLPFSTKHRTALTISAQATASVRTFAIAERTARIPSRQKKVIEIVIKNENGTVLSSPEGLIEGIQEFQDKTGKLVADSLVSFNQGKKYLKVLNMRNEAINIYHNSKIVRYTDLRNQTQENVLLVARNDRSIRRLLK